MTQKELASQLDALRLVRSIECFSEQEVALKRRPKKWWRKDYPCPDCKENRCIEEKCSCGCHNKEWMRCIGMTK